MISGVGLIGLIVLITSGGYLFINSGLEIGTMHWAFWLKMLMVAAILFYVVVMKILAIKAKRREGDEGEAIMKKMKRLAWLGPILAFLVISFAVLAFR